MIKDNFVDQFGPFWDPFGWKDDKPAMVSHCRDQNGPFLADVKNHFLYFGVQVCLAC